MKNRDLFTAIWLGEVDYSFAREFSKHLLHTLVKDGKKFIIFCTHPPTITFGRNMSDTEIASVHKQFENSENPPKFLSTDRGGKATFHDSNQLMIYPVVSLKLLNLGVKTFISKSLHAIVKAFEKKNITLNVDKDMQGIWLNGQKIASVGFRISQGLSDHGIALYFGSPAKEFGDFKPCGKENLNFISVSNLPDLKLTESQAIRLIIREFNSIYELDEEDSHR